MHVIIFSTLLILLIVTIIIIEFNYIRLKKRSNELIKELKKKIYILEFFYKENSVDFIEIVNYFNSLDTEEEKNIIKIKKIILNITVAIFLFFSIFKVLDPSEKIDLYQQNYKPLLNTSFIYRSSVNKHQDFQTAIDFYLSGNYDKADVIFNKQLEHNTTPELLLYSGLNKMAKNNFNLAIDLFNKLLYISDNYTIETQWYLALCYIKIGQKEKAKNIIEVLSVTDGIYKKKAQNILKNL